MSTNAPSPELRQCSACKLFLTRTKYSKNQYKKREGRGRCRACTADPGARSGIIDPLPVGVFLRTLFSEEEETAFREWVSPDMLARGDDGASNKRSTYDLLSNYTPMEKLCSEILDDSSANRLYPLQRAIVMGLEWEEGVRHVFERCDEIIAYPHPESGLLPFQLAAITEIASLDLTYNLLRARPELVLREIDDPNDMKYQPEFFSGYVAATEGTVIWDTSRNGATEVVEAVDWDNVEYVYSSADEGDSESVEENSFGDGSNGNNSE